MSRTTIVAGICVALGWMMPGGCSSGDAGQPCEGANMMICGGSCVDTSTSPIHCGACNKVCGAGGSCVAGQCATASPETCDGVDNDMDASTDEGEDGQPLTRPCSNACGQGTQACVNGAYGECTAPKKQVEVCDQVDNDCDGLTDEDVATFYYEDWDEDGYGEPDLAYAVYLCEFPYCNEIVSPNGSCYVEDNTDCDDTAWWIYPGADEDCDEYDNDCDGDTDEGCACAPIGLDRPCGTDEGVCQPGVQWCEADGWGECGGDDYVASSQEACTGLDDDCDGLTDEGLGDDPLEHNDTCSNARMLPNAVEGASPGVYYDLSLYHGQADAARDADWFVVNAVEGWHVSCVVNPLKDQCELTFWATLTVPADLHQNVEMCVHAGSCGSFSDSFCVDEDNYNVANQAYVMGVSWTGACGITDDREFYVEVRYAPEAPVSCSGYSLALEMTWDGSIESSCD